MSAPLRVLVYNTGSSSLKCGLYEVDESEARPLIEAQAQSIGQAGRLEVRDASGAAVMDEDAHFADMQAAVARIGEVLGRHAPAPQAIGHRLVHGGAQLTDHALIDEKVLAQLHAAEPYAPLHVPAALKVVEGARRLHPELPQAACLDTAFHRGLPDEARVLPLPRELEQSGLRRYGFHGLSCESILAKLERVPARLIIAHLGSGASLTAIRDGKSVDTSMGLSPAGGILMGTRSGDLDPGVLIWLARTQGMAADALEDLVMRRSGLAGISAGLSDMRKLREAATADPDAALAVRMFCLAVAKTVAAQMAVLGGLDLLVFTGGIGEHDARTRAETCAHLGWAGLALDEARNRGTQARVSSASSRVEIRALATAEGAAIARHVFALVRAAPRAPAAPQA
jgi:acetate kinase